MDPKANEFALAVNAWTEVLYGLVPVSEIEECYLRAMRERKSTFPLGVSEICAVYREERQSRKGLAKEKSAAELEEMQRVGREFEENIKRMELEAKNGQ